MPAAIALQLYAAVQAHAWVLVASLVLGALAAAARAGQLGPLLARLPPRASAAIVAALPPLATAAQALATGSPLGAALLAGVLAAGAALGTRAHGLSLLAASPSSLPLPAPVVAGVSPLAASVPPPLPHLPSPAAETPAPAPPSPLPDAAPQSPPPAATPEPRPTKAPSHYGPTGLVLVLGAAFALAPRLLGCAALKSDEQHAVAALQDPAVEASLEQGAAKLATLGCDDLARVEALAGALCHAAEAEGDTLAQAAIRQHAASLALALHAAHLAPHDAGPPPARIPVVVTVVSPPPAASADAGPPRVLERLARDPAPVDAGPDAAPPADAGVPPPASSGTGGAPPAPRPGLVERVRRRLGGT